MACEKVERDLQMVKWYYGAAQVPEVQRGPLCLRLVRSRAHKLLGAVRVAFERRCDELVWRLAVALWPLCASHKQFAEWIEAHELAAVTSMRIGDKAAEARPPSA